MNNPWYDENQPWMHTDPNAQLHMLETRWYQQQERDRIQRISLGSTQNDFAGLQNVAQQYAPQPRQYGGDIPWGGIAAGAAAGYYLANRAQQEPQPAVVRPEGWKSNVIGWYIAIALVLHLITGVFPMSVPIWIFAVGSAIWFPAWVAGIAHQVSVSEHNRHLLEKQS